METLRKKLEINEFVNEISIIPEKSSRTIIDYKKLEKYSENKIFHSYVN